MKKTILSTIALAASLATMAEAGPGLADGAAKFVGNIISGGSAPADFTTLWNQATAENGCKWESIEGTRGKFNWGNCDAAYNWAKNNGGHFKFHALVWGSQYPSWLPNLSVEETKKAITAWFDAVAAHYPDLEMIDVVNEAIRNNNGGYHSGYNNTKIIQALGGDNNGDYAFITTAFKMARERWPDAILIYNDYNTIQWDVDGGINLVNTIKKNGAPIDGYGLQAHDLMTDGGGNGGTGGGGNCMNYNTFKSTMQKIHSQTNNIPIFISEYDVPSTDDGIQEQCVKEQFSYWMEDENVAGITFWGYIYGQTWLSCHNKTVKGCSGLIKDGKDRKAMTWLKQYLADNKGVNATNLPTGVLTPVEPEPQTPFKGAAFDLSAKIEAEDFDIPGKGKGNNSYSVSGSCNDTWNTEYRKGTSVSIGEKNGGLVLGCNPTGNYFQYTINVAEAGTYDISATVAAEGSGALVFKVGDKVVSDSLKYTGTSWTAFDQVSGSITLDAGEQILTLEIAQGYIDVDWFQISKAGEGPIAIYDNVKFDQNTLQHYTVFDTHGVRMGVISGYGFDAAKEMLKASSAVTASGIYYLKNRATGAMQSVRIAR